MKHVSLTAAAALVLALNPVVGAAKNGDRGPRPQLDAPEAVMCTIDAATETVLVEWTPVDGAEKYSLDFDCEDPAGMVEVEVEYEPDDALVDTFVEVSFSLFPEPIVVAGEGAWTCLAKVKGQNPGRGRGSQNNPQTTALCEMPE